MPQDTRWRIGDTVVDALISEPPSWSVGDTESVEVYVGEESVAGRPTTEPVLESTFGGGLPSTLGGAIPSSFGTPAFETPHGGRLREDAYPDPSDSPFGTLRDLARYAGAATTEVSVDGVPIIREVIPDRAAVDSYVFDVVPIGADLDWATGSWVLVTDAADTSTPTGTDAHLTVELECLALAPLEEYSDRSDLKADMAPPVVPE